MNNFWDSLFNNHNASQGIQSKAPTPTQNPPYPDLLTNFGNLFGFLQNQQDNQGGKDIAGLKAQAPTNPQIESAKAAAEKARRAAEEAQQSAQRVAQQLAEQASTQAAQNLVLRGLDAGRQQPATVSNKPGTGRVTFLVDSGDPAMSLANGGFEHATKSLNTKTKPRGVFAAPTPMEPSQSTTQNASRQKTAIQLLMEQGRAKEEEELRQEGGGMSEQEFAKQNQKSYERALERKQMRDEAKRIEESRVRQARIAEELRRKERDDALVRSKVMIENAYTENRQQKREVIVAERENAIPPELRAWSNEQQSTRDAEANRAALDLAQKDLKDALRRRVTGMSKEGADAFTRRVVEGSVGREVMSKRASFMDTQGRGGR